MRNEKRVEQPVYDLEETQIQNLYDATDFSQFACQPHPAQKDHLACRMWEFYEQYGLPDCITSLNRLGTFMAEKMAEQFDEADRARTLFDIRTINGIIQLLIDLDSARCFPRY
jgi:hypothetical protein